MAGKHVRGVDPANSVTRALDARRGFTSQADVRETKHAVERLDAVGDKPNEIDGNLSVSGDIAWDGDGIARWLTGISYEIKQLVIRGIENAVEQDFFRFWSSGGAAGFEATNLYNGTDQYFIFQSSTTFNSPYVLMRGPGVFYFRNNADVDTAQIDPETGNFTTIGSVIQESAEASTTPVAGATSNTGVANIRRYMFFTLPTTEKWYVITGVEWLNKATVSGDIYFGVDLVDGNPPVSNESTLVAWGMRPQSGINAAQKATRVSSHPIRGGTTVGAWIAPTSATATLGSTTVASANLGKNVTAGSPPNVENTAWFATTAQYYIKAYYRGIR